MNDFKHVPCKFNVRILWNNSEHSYGLSPIPGKVKSKFPKKHLRNAEHDFPRSKASNYFDILLRVSEPPPYQHTIYSTLLTVPDCSASHSLLPIAQAAFQFWKCSSPPASQSSSLSFRWQSPYQATRDSWCTKSEMCYTIGGSRNYIHEIMWKSRSLSVLLWHREIFIRDTNS